MEEKKKKKEEENKEDGRELCKCKEKYSGICWRNYHVTKYPSKSKNEAMQ